MDPEKPQTINPLMRKRRAQEAEVASEPTLSLHSEPVSPSEPILPSEPALPSEPELPTEPTSPSTPVSPSEPTSPNEPTPFDTPTASAEPFKSNTTINKFNLRPSTNPVSDFRRRKSYKGVANPANSPRRRRAGGMNTRPVVPPTPAETPAPTVGAAPQQSNPTPVTEPTTNNANTSTNIKAKKSHKKALKVICALLMVILVAVVVALILFKFFPGNNTDIGSNVTDSSNTSANAQNSNVIDKPNTPSDADSTPPQDDQTPVTTELVDGVVEVKYGGLTDSTSLDLDHRIIKVTITNKSDEIQSIKLSLAATDEIGKILGISTLYTEGINPGESYELEAFTTTSLTSEELENAKFKIRSAATYQTKLDAPEEAQQL